MKILHTADWHLGRKLEGRSRHTEQLAVINELATICDRENIDLVVIAGDIFHLPNPSSEAEELFYYALDLLSQNGTRAIVAIAGNHDNPERLLASTPFAKRLGIYLVGFPFAEINHCNYDHKNIQCLHSEPSFLELKFVATNENICIIALPYPSESRLKKIISADLAEENLQLGYSDLIKELLASLADKFRPDSINLLTSHFYMHGGVESGTTSEMKIQQIGGIYAVDSSALPINADYVALGHLHRPQKIKASVPCYYSGSLLQCTFAETTHQKSVQIIDITVDQTDNKTTHIKEVLLTAGKPLIRYTAKNGLPELLDWLDHNPQDAWLELEIHLAQPITVTEIQEIKAKHTGIINIIPIYQQTASEEKSFASLRTNTPEELFRAFYKEKNNQRDAPEDLINLFLNLTQNPSPDEVNDASD